MNGLNIKIVKVEEERRDDFIEGGTNNEEICGGGFNMRTVC